MDANLKRAIDMLNQSVLRLQKELDELRARVAALEARNA
jgi:cell division protein FtsB